MSYPYLIAIGLGILPSIIWLTFYLKEDVHPEPKKWLIIVFFLGMAVTPIVVNIEWLAINFFSFLNREFPRLFGDFLRDLAIIFIGVALVEEFFKYLAVRLAMKKNPVFDEPADAMIYMVVSALGFAAVENIMVMHAFAPFILVDPAQPLSTLAIRFVGATFLHTLASGIIGFYYAMSLVKINHLKVRRRWLLLKGLFLAALLHGAFNYFIIILREPWVIYFSIPLLVISIFVLKDFKILRKINPNNFNNQ
ncbi:MAG: PrsW family intramembrane metalloprotease [bacterium]|nr:PrsW family intramembrane metalloprotease [bacterium]